MFRRNISPPFSRSKSRPNKKNQHEAGCIFHAAFLLGFLFDLKTKSDIFLRNVGYLTGLYGVVSQKT
jgi:hypothetical protein